MFIGVGHPKDGLDTACLEPTGELATVASYGTSTGSYPYLYYASSSYDSYFSTPTRNLSGDSRAAFASAFRF